MENMTVSIRTIMIFPEFKEMEIIKVKEINIDFKTVVNKILVEMMGENEESIIIIEHELC